MADFTAGEVLTAAALDAAINAVGTANTQTANYTLALSDEGKLIRMNTSAAGTVTIPPASSVAFTMGAAIAVAQVGAGQTTIAAGSGVTLQSYGSATKLAGQYAAAQLYKTATDGWLLVGNITS